jgi:hypothetical protein
VLQLATAAGVSHIVPASGFDPLRTGLDQSPEGGPSVASVRT